MSTSMSRPLVVAVAASLAVGLLVGGLIGHFGTTISDTPTGTSDDQRYVLDKYAILMADQWQQGVEDGTNRWIIDEIKTENIEEYLKELSKEPHLAATPRDDQLAEYIRQHFVSAGFDWAEKIAYNVYLSRPDPKNPNKIYILDGNNAPVFVSRHREVFKEGDVPDFVDAFNAYTPKGDVTTLPGTAVVYVNYGRVEDFKQLAQLGVDVTGKVAIMRYGKIFRGNKVDNAERSGAVGAILFSDPDDVAREGGLVYPDSWWLPETGMQRGSTFLGDGDPLTPGWPSTEHAHRIDPSKADFVGIPAQPMGYADAENILKMLDGPAAPPEWQGGLNMTGGYKLGPNFLPEYSTYKLRLLTNNEADTYRSYNVFGTIRGAVEQDRYVLIGNHRDAWGFGASDPSSGTAQLMEVSRVLGELRKTGWRPRRTLVFCSWGAEEYGLIGSTEWVEEHVDKLQARAVTYVNTDTCATGPVLEAPASPLLWDAIRAVTKMVPGVRDSSKTVFDEWQQFHADVSPKAPTKPIMKTLGSGSDFAPFIFYAGVPAVDIWFRRDKRVHNISTYPSYHTGFETFKMVSLYNDPGFRSIQGCGRIASLTLKYFADSLVLPYGLTSFPERMAEGLQGFNESKVREKIMEFYPDYVHLEEAVANLTETTLLFHASIKNNELDPLELRRINDQMMKFEQTFIIPGGLPGRPTTRHSVFAPSQFDSYASSGFPGITDLMYDYDDLTGLDKLERQEEIKQHVSLLTIITNRAAGLLTDLHQFQPN